MTQRVLCLGDSLTAGELGISWLNRLALRPSMKSYDLINAGENGFTLAGLECRLEKEQNKAPLPDILVVEGGANDILLPHMQTLGRDWDPFIRKLQRHGSHPASSDAEFEQTLKRILSIADSAGISTVICCTIPCLGEDLTSELNRKRQTFNRIIRENAPLCADPALRFERELLPFQPGSPYLFKTPEELPEDALAVRKEGAETLSRLRGLRLTIDGAHLNNRGADLFADELEPFLTR